MEIYHPRDEELIREMRRVRRSYKRRRLALGFSILLIISIAAGLFLFHRYYQLAVVHGSSMGATLPEGTLVLVRRAEPDQTYESGDIILYDKRIARPVEITILSPKGKPRRECRYILYREKGTTREYYSTAEESVSWRTETDQADVFVSSPDGTMTMETGNLQNGEYWLREIEASYGQDVLKEPIPFSVNNAEKTQMKRVLAAPGERIVLGTNTETRVNGWMINTAYTSGRTADASTEGRRVIVAKDRYFVQGDQLSLSVDSRDAEYGTVSAEDVRGRAEFALWPLRCFGTLTGTQTTVAEGEPEVAE